MKRRAETLREELTNIPNLLTYGRVLAIPICLALMARGDPRSSFAASLVFGVAATTDFFDGWLARRMKLVSVIGQFLDPLADKLIVMATLVMMVHLGRVPVWLAVLIIARETTITGLRSIATAEGMLISAGYSGKLKTAFQLVAVMFLLIHYEYRINFGLFTTTANFNIVGLWLLYLSLGFSLWSAGEYFAGFIRHLTGSPQTAA
jgi:CDP-diacylglycerol--glycerol-3-phosphate 3-phosphatidyltransferase